MTDEELQAIRARIDRGQIHRDDSLTLLAEVERLRAERMTECEAIEDLLPCQFRFTHRERPCELNVVYSVRRLIAAMEELRAVLQPAMEELEAANSLADILPVLRAALGEPG